MADGDPLPLVPVARLLGRLLVRELDHETLAELRTPAVAAALSACDLRLPEAPDLERLAHEWCDCFLHPTSGLPPVQSVWQHGEYSGNCKQTLDEIARAAWLELAAGSRGAPSDQIGCILLLWSEVIGSRPDLARRLQRDHLPWATRALAPIAAGGGFYGRVATATIRFVAELSAP